MVFCYTDMFKALPNSFNCLIIVLHFVSSKIFNIWNISFGTAPPLGSAPGSSVAVMMVPLYIRGVMYIMVKLVLLSRCSVVKALKYQIWGRGSKPPPPSAHVYSYELSRYCLNFFNILSDGIWISKCIFPNVVIKTRSEKKRAGSE